MGSERSSCTLEVTQHVTSGGEGGSGSDPKTLGVQRLSRLPLAGRPSGWGGWEYAE